MCKAVNEQNAFQEDLVSTKNPDTEVAQNHELVEQHDHQNDNIAMPIVKQNKLRVTKSISPK